MKRANLLHHFSRSEAGTSLVEFAIVTPLLALLLLGLIDFGRYMQIADVVTNAARAGVQYGAQGLGTATDTVGMQNAALGDAQSLPGMTAQATYWCTPLPSCAMPAVGRRIVYVQVTTTGVFQSLFQYPGLPTSVRVSDHAIMQVAQ
ncbi:hypothetical protein EPN52_00940 [bacterium]|nr:MAG: hypothetical protein EPN52_00940 [bacterium]